MLKVVPKTWSYSFSVMDGSDAVAQAIDICWWSDKGVLRIEDATYTARREKYSYFLESETGIVARALQPRKLSSKLVIEHSGKQYELRPKSAFSSEFLLFDGPEQVGSVYADGIFKKTATVDLPKTLPLYVQIFIIWLAMTLWKHSNSVSGI